jgi:hypothetical protein
MRGLVESTEYDVIGKNAAEQCPSDRVWARIYSVEFYPGTLGLADPTNVF